MKRKEGAKKERDRKRKNTETSASQYKNLVDLFNNSNVISVDINEEDKDIGLESEPSGVNVVTIDSFAAESRKSL